MDHERTHLDDGIGRLVSAAAGTIARWYRQAATRRALMACSDRVLADIGIERDDIPAMAGSSSGSFAAGPVNWRDTLTQRLETARRRRRIYRELMAYSDRDLDELGIRRRDISGIARAA